MIKDHSKRALGQKRDNWRASARSDVGEHAAASGWFWPRQKRGCWPRRRGGTCSYAAKRCQLHTRLKRGSPPKTIAGVVANSKWHVMCAVTATVTSILLALVPPSRCAHPRELLASGLYQTQMSPMFARAIGRKLKTLALTLLWWHSPLGQFLHYFSIDDLNLDYSQLPYTTPSALPGSVVAHDAYQCYLIIIYGT